MSEVFINENGLRTLIGEIFKGVNERIAERIVTAITSESGSKVVPSAKAVYELVESMNHISFSRITGSIESVTNPKTNIIYLQRDTEEDTTYTMYVYIEGEWVSIGDTNFTIQEMTTEEVTQIFNEEFAKTKPDLSDTPEQDDPVTVPDESSEDTE